MSAAAGMAGHSPARGPRQPDADGDRWGRMWLALVITACLVVLAGVPVPLFDGDDPFYATVARNVLATGEWITLRHPAFGLFDKPPLTIWLLAISFRVGGFTYAAHRFWHVLFSLALLLAVYRLARLAAGHHESLLATLLASTGVLVLYHTLIPQQDIPLAVFLTLAFSDYLRYRRFGRTGLAVRAGLWVALGTLTKGLVAPLVFGLVVAADALLGWRQKRDLGHWRWS